MEIDQVQFNASSTNTGKELKSFEAPSSRKENERFVSLWEEVSPVSGLVQQRALSFDNNKEAQLQYNRCVSLKVPVQLFIQTDVSIRTKDEHIVVKSKKLIAEQLTYEKE